MKFEILDNSIFKDKDMDENVKISTRIDSAGSYVVEVYHSTLLNPIIIFWINKAGYVYFPDVLREVEMKSLGFIIENGRVAIGYS